MRLTDYRHDRRVTNITMIDWRRIFCSLLITGCAVSIASSEVLVEGELRKWHKVTLRCDGPHTSETAMPNPFVEYRLNAVFTHVESGRKYQAPGYFAADGDAANTSADDGNVWFVHFAPDAEGQWHYELSFRKGSRVAVDDDASAGESAAHCDGATGQFAVGASDKTGRDFRRRGRLEYVGQRYLKFAETGEYFLKCGADAPENLLAYADFDGDFKADGHKDNLVKTWQSHIRDWREGDPQWQNGKGRGLIGAVNYLADKGMNAFSFITMNIDGDDQNAFPYVTYDDHERFDVSRLAQWEVVFEHADHQGMYLHFKTQETENETLLDDGELGPRRKLYYRELIARFGHHLALNWNLGEENGKWAKKEKFQTTKQRLAMARYFHDHDPYLHPIVIHNGQPFDDLLGPNSALTGASVQTNRRDFAHVHDSVLRYVKASQAADKPWVVACDEPGDANHSLVTDEEDPQHDLARQNALWGALLAGGAGIEWYFGYQHPQSDLTCQDWRSRDRMWDQCRHALDFFNNEDIPFCEMHSADDLIDSKHSYCFCKPGSVYIFYLKRGGTATVDLSAADGQLLARWYNPRNGAFVGSPSPIAAVRHAKLGPPPVDEHADWVVLIQ